MLIVINSLAPTITTVVLQTDPGTAAVVAVFILILISWSGFIRDVFSSNEDQEAPAETISTRDASSKSLSTDESKSKTTLQSSDREKINRKPDEEELKSDDTAVDKESNQEIDTSESGKESVETYSSADGETDSLGEFDEATQNTVRQQAKEQNNQPKSDSIPQQIPHTTELSIQYDDIRNDNPLGRGGNADVYHATITTADGQLDIAVKEPRMSGTVHTDTVERLLNEAETWQKLDDHDHIVSVLDYGSEPLPWIAMEYMDVGHLGTRAGNLELDQALWTAIATTMAVRHAHRRGVAHLDLKPANVLFQSVEGAWDVPKVADWGLSKHLLDHSKSVEGVSPHYAAPEQFDDDFGGTDDVTDVYQLGAVFYELFTGRPPFEGKPFKVMEQLKTEQPTPPSELADIPPALDDILLTALAKQKDDRYETVVNLRNDLQALLNQD